MDRQVPFNVHVSRFGARVVVAPEGELDIATAPSVSEALPSDLPAGSVVFDLRGLEFMDTAGIRLIVEQQRVCEEQGVGFAVVRGAPSVQRLLDIAGLTSRLTIIDRPEEPIDGIPASQ